MSYVNSVKNNNNRGLKCYTWHSQYVSQALSNAKFKQISPLIFSLLFVWRRGESWWQGVMYEKRCYICSVHVCVNVITLSVHGMHFGECGGAWKMLCFLAVVVDDAPRSPFSPQPATVLSRCPLAHGSAESVNLRRELPVWWVNPPIHCKHYLFVKFCKCFYFFAMEGYGTISDKGGLGTKATTLETD